MAVGVRSHKLGIELVDQDRRMYVLWSDVGELVDDLKNQFKGYSDALQSKSQAASTTIAGIV